MGGWEAAVYTPEQQKKLGVDEMGQPVTAKDEEKDKSEPITTPVVPIGDLNKDQTKPITTKPIPISQLNKPVGAVGPRWTWDPNFEKPAGKKEMGGWEAAVYTPEQQKKLGVDEMGKEVSKIGAVGPRWTWDKNFEKPAGEENMGTWKMAVY